MTAAFEGSVEPGADDGRGLAVGDEAGGEHQDVGVIVCGDELSDGNVPGEAGADALMFVQGYGHAVAGAAQGDAKVDFAAFDCGCKAVSEVGVIDALSGVGAVIDYFDAAALKHLHELELIVHAGVIVANSNFHLIPKL